MKGDRYLFEIPIYRCSTDQHDEDMNTAKAKWMAPFKGSKGTPAYKRAEVAFDREGWFPWKYNEAIGWISILANVAYVRGELWFVRNRISKQLRKKAFYWIGKLFEYHPPRLAEGARTSERVFGELRDTIMRSLKENDLSKYSVDLECFDNTGRYLDWELVLGLCE